MPLRICWNKLERLALNKTSVLVQFLRERVDPIPDYYTQRYKLNWYKYMSKF